MGNLCSSCIADTAADTLAYNTKEVSKYAGTEQYRPQVISDAQRSSHSSSPERRRASGRDAPTVVLEQQDGQLEEQAWHSPGAGAAVQQQGQDGDTGAPDTPSAPFSWTKGELIGIGAFGRVFSALNNVTGELVAVKQVSFAKDEALQGRVAEHIKALEAEVEVLKTLKHENIVRYLGTEITADTLHIFLEYVPGGSIASLLAKFGPFPESVIRVYTAQLLRGLEYLHQKGIMHRDIKGANILIDKHGTVKLADFGASKKIEDLATVGSGSKSIRGTPYWMAPEVIKQTGHGCPADIWSLACTVIEMATGKPPWSSYTAPVAAMFQIASSKDPPPLPEHLSREAKDFLLLCFNRVARDRANATRLLKHPFLANVQLQQPLPFPSTPPQAANSCSSSPAGATSASSCSSVSRTPGSAGPAARNSSYQPQQYAARQSAGMGANSSQAAKRPAGSSLRPPPSMGMSVAQAAAMKAAEAARSSPSQARGSPMRQLAEHSGSVPAGAGTAAGSQVAPRSDAPGVAAAGRAPNQQQQQQHIQQEQPPSKQQQQQLPAGQSVHSQQPSPQPLQQQQQHGAGGSVASSREGLPQESCMTLVDWNPVEEPSWVAPYQPIPPYQPVAPPSKAIQQQQAAESISEHQPAVEQQPDVDAPYVVAMSSRASTAAASGGSGSSSNSSIAAASCTPGQLRHGSLPGPIGSGQLISKRGLGSCSVAGPLSQGPAGRASSGLNLAAAASSSSGTGSAGSAAAGALLNSMLSKGSKQSRQHGSSVLASMGSMPASSTAAAAAPVAADSSQASGAAGAGDARSSAQDQWVQQSVDVAMSTKRAQWENELYEELERHRKEQRASRAAGAAQRGIVAALQQRQ